MLSIWILLASQWSSIRACRGPGRPNSMFRISLIDNKHSGIAHTEVWDRKMMKQLMKPLPIVANLWQNKDCLNISTFSKKQIQNDIWIDICSLFLVVNNTFIVLELPRIVHPLDLKMKSSEKNRKYLTNFYLEWTVTPLDQYVLICTLRFSKIISGNKLVTIKHLTHLLVQPTTRI